MFRRFTIALGISLAVAPLVTSCLSGANTATRSAAYVVEGGVDVGDRWRNNRILTITTKTETLAADSIHDPENSAINTLQDPTEAMGSFPLDRRGDVDWVKAIELGIIQPRANLQGTAEMSVLDKDILFKRDDQMPWVNFPHKGHTQWLACSSCHPDIFIEKKGANKLTMDAILAGEYCGRCHGKVSFSLWACERCHNVPHEGTPDNWIERYGGIQIKDELQ